MAGNDMLLSNDSALSYWMLDYIHESGHTQKDVVEVINDIDDVTLVYRDGLTTTIPWGGKNGR